MNSATIIKRKVLAVILACGLVGCVGEDSTPSESLDPSDPSHWVTKTWVEDQSTHRRIPKTVSPKSTSDHWLTNKLPGMNTAFSTGNLWDRLPSGYQMPETYDNARVQSQIRWFMNNQGILNRTSKRAAPYMYYIYQQIQRRNLPAELVMLPIIESAYNPFNISSQGAAGLWQMMPGTASSWGIKQNWWYDGRRDIFASTNAALDYLTYLQSYFSGNWLLALAAYNCGEGCVQSAIRRNARMGRPTDFWSLPLPQETRAYVPRLLALAAIIKNRAAYPVDLPAIEDKPYLTQIDVGSQIDLSHAARLATMSYQELHQLNPGYNRSATDPSGTHLLILPIDKIDTFKQNIASMPSTERTTFSRYKVRRGGESLSNIAERFDTSANRLRQINNISSNRVRSGNVILVPVTSIGAGRYHPIVQNQPDTETTTVANNMTTDASSNNSTNAPFLNSFFGVDNSTAKETPPQSQNGQEEMSNEVENENSATTAQATNESAERQQEEDTQPPATPVRLSRYKVKSGDTMYSIAAKQHLPANQLMHLNHLKNPTLHPGMVLQIPSNHTENSVIAKTNHPVPKLTLTKKSNLTIYKIHAGDTLAKISHRTGVSISRLKQLNKISGTGSLPPGKKLILPT